jgi:hypothetical protein
MEFWMDVCEFMALSFVAPSSHFQTAKARTLTAKNCQITRIDPNGTLCENRQGL